MTETAKHTPGPWTVAPRDEDAEPWDCVDIMAGKFNVAAAIYDGNFYDAEYCDDDLYLPVVEANARLIAAAPELLEHIKALRAWVIHWRKDKECNLTPTESSLVSALEVANFAIAKAEGRT